jgi:hypothetical protein
MRRKISKKRLGIFDPDRDSMFDIDDKELIYCGIIVVMYLTVLFNPFR